MIQFYVITITLVILFVLVSILFGVKSNTEKTLKRPVWAPPIKVYIIIFIALSLLRMYISYRGHLKSGGDIVWDILFMLVSVMTVLSSIVTYQMECHIAAFWMTVVLLLITVSQFLAIWQYDRTLSYLLIPSIFWLCFLCVLNWEIFKLNKINLTVRNSKTNGK